MTWRARLIFTNVPTVMYSGVVSIRDNWAHDTPSFRAKARCVSPPLASRSLRRTILAESISIGELHKGRSIDGANALLFGRWKFAA